VKYLNNVIGADHGKLKMLIKPVRGFETMHKAYATLEGFEVYGPYAKDRLALGAFSPASGARCA
jgi:transposase-like protein